MARGRSPDGAVVLSKGCLRRVLDSGSFYLEVNTTVQVLQVVQVKGKGFLLVSDSESCTYFGVGPKVAACIADDKIKTGQLCILEKIEAGSPCPVLANVSPMLFRSGKIGDPTEFNAKGFKSFASGDASTPKPKKKKRPSTPPHTPMAYSPPGSFQDPVTPPVQTPRSVSTPKSLRGRSAASPQAKKSLRTRARSGSTGRTAIPLTSLPTTTAAPRKSARSSSTGTKTRTNLVPLPRKRSANHLAPPDPQLSLPIPLPDPPGCPQQPAGKWQIPSSDESWSLAFAESERSTSGETDSRRSPSASKGIASPVPKARPKHSPVVAPPTPPRECEAIQKEPEEDQEQKPEEGRRVRTLEEQRKLRQQQKYDQALKKEQHQQLLQLQQQSQASKLQHQQKLLLREQQEQGQKLQQQQMQLLQEQQEQEQQLQHKQRMLKQEQQEHEQKLQDEQKRLMQEQQEQEQKLQRQKQEQEEKLAEQQKQLEEQQQQCEERLRENQRELEQREHNLQARFEQQMHEAQTELQQKVDRERNQYEGLLSKRKVEEQRLAAQEQQLQEQQEAASKQLQEQEAMRLEAKREQEALLAERKKQQEDKLRQQEELMLAFRREQEEELLKQQEDLQQQQQQQERDLKAQREQLRRQQEELAAQQRKEEEEKRELLRKHEAAIVEAKLKQEHLLEEQRARLLEEKRHQRDHEQLLEEQEARLMAEKREREEQERALAQQEASIHQKQLALISQEQAYERRRHEQSKLEGKIVEQEMELSKKRQEQEYEKRKLEEEQTKQILELQQMQKQLLDEHKRKEEELLAKALAKEAAVEVEGRGVITQGEQVALDGLRMQFRQGVVRIEEAQIAPSPVAVPAVPVPSPASLPASSPAEVSLEVNEVVVKNPPSDPWGISLTPFESTAVRPRRARFQAQLKPRKMESPLTVLHGKHSSPGAGVAKSLFSEDSFVSEADLSVVSEAPRATRHCIEREKHVLKKAEPVQKKRWAISTLDFEQVTMQDKPQPPSAVRQLGPPPSVTQTPTQTPTHTPPPSVVGYESTDDEGSMCTAPQAMSSYHPSLTEGTEEGYQGGGQAWGCSTVKYTGKTRTSIEEQVKALQEQLEDNKILEVHALKFQELVAKGRHKNGLLILDTFFNYYRKVTESLKRNANKDSGLSSAYRRLVRESEMWFGEFARTLLQRPERVHKYFVSLGKTGASHDPSHVFVLLKRLQGWLASTCPQPADERLVCSCAEYLRRCHGMAVHP